MKKVNLFFSKKDLIFDFEKFSKNKQNLLIITGMVGSGKSSTAHVLSNKYNATVIIQDWLAWSDYYNSEESKLFLNLFIKKYPETENYFKTNTWRKKDEISSDKKQFYKNKFNKLVFSYAKNNPNELFIFEGSNIFKDINPKILKNYPIIIKRTSSLKSLIRRYKRDFTEEHKINLTHKIKYTNMVLKQSKCFHINDRVLLNKFIDNLILIKR